MPKKKGQPHRYFELFDLAPVGYFTLDDQGRITEVNLAAADLLASSRRNLVGREFSRFVAVDSRERFQEHSRRMRATHARDHCELLLVRADETTFEALVNSVVVTDSGQATASCWTIVTDISENRKAQQELMQLNSMLASRIAEATTSAERGAAEMQVLAMQLTDAERLERRRVAQLLHDHLQQLLVAVNLSLQSLRSRTADPDAVDSLGNVISMVRESLKASRTVAADLSPAVLYDRGLAAALEWLARTKQEKYGLKVEVCADPASNPQNESISSFLFQAVHELLFNVFKHAQADHARVTMLRREPGHVQIRVEDQGRGCDPGRADLEGLQANGEGFGLFSIKKRLELLGGSFFMDSSPGAGCRVWLEAPIHETTKDVQRSALEKTRPGTAVAPARKESRDREAIRVLLVDDHKIVREGLAGLLQEEPDIDLVGEASDGQSAVELTRSLNPDVVVMDVSMPFLSGIEATRMITSEMSGVRVIGLSMHEDVDMAAAMREVGAVGYVSKSVAAEELLAAIRSACSPGNG